MDNFVTEIKTGNVIYAFPSFGYAWIRPSGSTNITLTLFCRLPFQGGITGGCIVAAPTPGSVVQYKQEGNTHRGYIVAVVSQGSLNRGFSQVYTLCTMSRNIFNSASNLVKLILSRLRLLKLGIGLQATTAGLLDQQPGDIYMGDRFGPGIFCGRGQLTIRGSDLSCVLFDAFHDKITTLTVKNDLYTLSSLLTKNTKLDKYLKASGSYLGLGGIEGKREEIFKVLKNGKNVEYTKPSKLPLYRFQSFSGGAVQGVCHSIVAPITSDEEHPAILSFTKEDYDGTSLKISQGFTSIKTLRTSGISEYAFPLLLSSKDLEDELKARKNNLNKRIQLYKDFELSDNGIERALQLTLLLSTKDTAGLLTQGIKESDSNLLCGIDLLTLAYNKKLRFKGKAPAIKEGFILDYLSNSIVDTLTGKHFKRFDNSSIISQDPDGSVTIKDGWGSQITMSHGNIYISSALDTFIRPGRDLIAMVPRHLSLTANGQVLLASKQDIKIGAEKNLVMASASSGQPGYTVLLNRSTTGRTSESGMVIRSNGNLSMTASDDIHIGINDKRRVNLGDSGANTGTGSVYIEGNRVRVESNNELRLAGSLIGVYAYTGSKGSGILVASASVTAISSNVNLDSGNIKIGKSDASYRLKLGIKGQKDITLLQGNDIANILIRGSIDCQKNITVGGYVHTVELMIASNYLVTGDKTEEQIPALGKEATKVYKTGINDMFKLKLVGFSYTLAFTPELQPWYNDDYICKKLLSFFDSWSVKTMPQMCWQATSFYNTNKLLLPIRVAPTGAEQLEYTCAYPGKQAWGNDKEACKMLTVGPDLNVIKVDSNEAPLLKNAYKTNTER